MAAPPYVSRVSQVRARLLVGTGLLLGAALLGGLYACHVLRQTPFMAGPDRISICGRDYVLPGGTFPREELGATRLTRIGSVMTWQGRREVWGQRGPAEPECGTGVYLRVGSNAFRGYTLSGGP